MDTIRLNHIVTQQQPVGKRNPGCPIKTIQYSETRMSHKVLKESMTTMTMKEENEK
jgi:hypothetical protein